MKPFITFFLFTILILPCNTYSQAVPKGVNKLEVKQNSVITSKKWICIDVSRKKLTTQDFRFEMGNELSLSIDKKYSFKNNDYNYQSGNWRIDGKFIYFFYNSLDGNHRTLSAKYKILTLDNSTLRLKRMDKPKGKLTFK